MIRLATLSIYIVNAELLNQEIKQSLMISGLSEKHYKTETQLKPTATSDDPYDCGTAAYKFIVVLYVKMKTPEGEIKHVINHSKVPGSLLHAALPINFGRCRAWTKLSTHGLNLIRHVFHY